ncbi:hypothetical protein AUK10_02710 [Candidatus Gracilibacteria bacterium CG2_30_37_12]|nr:MAG: hypothetical protein AUK10_02710 [Candidatus Gracilibacteria bacterium CG2_30_37_12]
MKETNTSNAEEITIQDNDKSLKKKIFTYVRESKQGGSVNTFEAQITAIRGFMRRNNLNQYEEIAKQEGKSAFMEGRPKFNDMIETLKRDKKKEYVGIVFFDVSRMARNSADFVKIEELIREGYKIYSVSENIIDSPAGKYFFRMIQMESIYYSDRQSSKSQRYNLTILCGNPYTHTGGNGITYGYNKGGTKTPVISIHPVNSLIVKEIFKLSKEGETGRDIETLLKNKFEKLVADYNSKIGKEKTFYGDESTDEEDEEKDQEIFTLMEEGEYDEKNSRISTIHSVPAFIPNERQISDVLTGKGRIQYNGYRKYQFRVNFEEDIPLFTSIIKGYENGGKTPFILSEDQKLQKGEQILKIDVREKLMIVEDDLFLAVMRKIKTETDETKKHIQVYKGLLFCSCGRPIMGTMQADGIYYWCKSRSEKRRKVMLPGNECHRTTKLPETEMDNIFANEILSKILIGYQIYDKGSLAKGLYSGRMTTLTNQLRSENSALTVLQKKLKSSEEDKVLLRKIERKKAIINEYENLMEELKAKAIKEEHFIFGKIENYLNEQKDKKEGVAQLFLKRMEMDEPHDGETLPYIITKRIPEKVFYTRKR